MGDGGADVPAGRCRDAELHQRDRRAACICVPVTGAGWREGGQRLSLVALVERAVCHDETDRRPDCHADAAALDEDVVFEAADQPRARRFLNDDETQAPGLRRPFRGLRPRRRNEFMQAIPGDGLMHTSASAMRVTCRGSS